jgi:hypothetical protein
MLRNCKKAIAFAKEKLNVDGSLKSGLNADDVWEHVLDKMYEYSKTQGRSYTDDDDEDNADKSNESVAAVIPNDRGERPTTWYFRGFWSFHLFGPLAPVSEQCALFNVDSLDALAVGRKAIRAASAKKKKNDRDHNPKDDRDRDPDAPLTPLDINAVMSPSGFKRGMGMKEKTAIVHLAQQQMIASTRDDELEFDTITKSIELIKDELKFALEIVRELKVTDKDDDAWKTVFQLQKRLSQKNHELTDYQANKRYKREEEKKKGSIFDSFLKSVNQNYQVPPSVSVPSLSSFSSVSGAESLMDSPMNPAVTGLLELAAQETNLDENVEIVQI